jgi:predicted TIM-barrel fold metal-dependent hydrolase/N-acetylglutamate synthase-like GNAT family acetyltransferase
MKEIIDVHIHVGHRFEWTRDAKGVWMETGPYSSEIFDENGTQVPGRYGDVIKREGVLGGILIPEYSPLTAGVMPFERAREINAIHPEFVPFANLNPNYHTDLLQAFAEQRSLGAKGLKLQPVHGFFYANDTRLYPVYARCEKEGLPVMFHAGTSLFRGSKMRFVDPYTFDDVISDFPDLTVVLCHGGRGFWYHIAEFMVKRFKNVFIDISGLPPRNLLEYYPSMKKYKHKFLFGSDFPGVPGIKKNYEQVRELVGDDEVMDQIRFKNAYDLFGFWKEGIFGVTDLEIISNVINDGAQRYREIIPEDRYNDPYMPMEELREEAKRMRIYGYIQDKELLGIIGKEKIKDTTLIRHAYVIQKCQRKGIGSKLLTFIEKSVDTEFLLVGTWRAATWAIDFYQKHGFVLMENEEELLRKYWDIPERQIETSCVLGKRMKRG